MAVCAKFEHLLDKARALKDRVATSSEAKHSWRVAVTNIKVVKFVGAFEKTEKFEQTRRTNTRQ